MRETRGAVARHRRSHAEADSLVRDFEQSGLSRKAFCSAQGIALHTLDYYRHRDRVRRSAMPAEELLPLELISSSPTIMELRVELANGRRIVVEAGFDACHLKRLLAVLEG